MAVIADILVAAALWGCEPGEVLSYRVCENGDIYVIGPTGQKFLYTKVLVDEQREILEAKAKPKPKPRARRTPAKAKPKLASKPSAISTNDEKKH